MEVKMKINMMKIETNINEDKNKTQIKILTRSRHLPGHRAWLPLRCVLRCQGVGSLRCGLSSAQYASKARRTVVLQCVSE